MPNTPTIPHDLSPQIRADNLADAVLRRCLTIMEIGSQIAAAIRTDSHGMRTALGQARRIPGLAAELDQKLAALVDQTHTLELAIDRSLVRSFDMAASLAAGLHDEACPQCNSPTDAAPELRDPGLDSEWRTGRTIIACTVCQWSRTDGVERPRPATVDHGDPFTRAMLTPRRDVPQDGGDAVLGRGCDITENGGGRKAGGK